MARNREWANGMRRIAAAIVVLLLAVMPAAPAAAGTAPCRPPPEALAEFVRTESGRIAADRAHVEQTVRRLLGTGVSLAFGEARERVPAYGDWAYGWVESYVTSYELLLRSLFAGVQAGVVPWDPAVRDAVVTEAQRFVFGRFDQIVIRPAQLPDRLQSEWEAATQLAETEWQRARRRVRAAADRFLAAHCGGSDARRPAMADRAAPDSADDPAAPVLHAADGSPVAAIGPIGAIYRLDHAGSAETIFLRSTRPFGARLAIMAARLTEAGSALAAGSIFGIGGLSGPITGFVGAIATVWTIDWAINRGDELLNRAGMEEELRGLIGEIEREMLDGMSSELAGALERAAEEDMQMLARLGG